MQGGSFCHSHKLGRLTALKFERRRTKNEKGGISAALFVNRCEILFAAKRLLGLGPPA
jgi:hypothetical protein